MRYGRAHQEFADKLGIKDPIQILRKISVPLYASMGLGRLEVVEACGVSTNCYKSRYVF